MITREFINFSGLIELNTVQAVKISHFCNNTSRKGGLQ